MASKKGLPLHPELRRCLRVDPHESDEDVLRFFRGAAKRACKPCWELKYCPYGPLVEDYPLLPGTREQGEDHTIYLITCLEGGVLPDGTSLSPSKRRMFERMVADFNPDEYPEAIPDIISEAQCTVFGHLCPVYWAAEPFTETSESRRRGRYIPFAVKMRVVRRDNYTCQACGKHLNDKEVEFDHIIPVARGGSSEEHNIRLTCFDCNREKTDRIQI